MSCCFAEPKNFYADEFNRVDFVKEFNKFKKDIYKTFNLPIPPTVQNIEKIIFNDPCVILIDILGDKTIIRTQNKEKYDMMFGYYMVLCKYLSDNDTYSELLAHVYEEKSKEKRIYIMDAFLMGNLGIKMCRKIDWFLIKQIPSKPKTNNKKNNYTINFQEVFNV